MSYPTPKKPIIEENYYLRLALPIESPVKNKDVLSARIDDMNLLWSTFVQDSDRGAACSKYIEEKDTVKRELEGDATRQRHIDAAQKEIDTRFHQAVSAIVHVRGFLSKEDVKKLGDSFGYWLPDLEGSIKKTFGNHAIAPVTTWHIWPKEPKKTGITPTPDEKMDDWERYLLICGKNDIYKFLGIASPKTSSATEITNKCKDICVAAKKKENTKPAEAAAEDELATKLEEYFSDKSEDRKKAYDEALKTYPSWKKLEKSTLVSLVERDTKGSVKPISFESYQRCVILAMGNGFDADGAQWRVYNWFVNKKRVIILSPAGSEWECPKCKKKNAFGKHTCSQCGFVFEIQCPKCAANHEDVWVACDKPVCEKCGGKIADLYKAETEYNEAVTHFNSGKLDDAERLARVTLSHWTDHAGSIKLLGDIQNERVKRQKMAAEQFRNGLKLSGTVSASISEKGDVVRLGWGAAVAPVAGGDASNITYRIVRKAEGQPTGPQDGEKLSEQSGTSFHDTKPDVGLGCYYAVYACYEGSPNSAGICSSKAVLVTQEVERKPVKIRPNRLELSWKLPTNAKGVICCRKKGGDPVSATDGETINVTFPPGDRLTDNGLENETYYGYRVCVIFTGTDGRAVQTVGITLGGSPSEESLVPKVKDPRVKRVAGNLQVTWEWPDGCAEALVLYRSDAKPDGPDDEIATKRRVPKREYDAEDAYYIEGCGDGTYHVAVCAADTSSTETQYSAPEYADSFGAKDMAQLTYRVAPMRKGFLGMGGFGGATLSVRVSNGSGVRPALCLVEGIRLPTSKADGVCVVPEFPEEKMGDKLETTLNAPMAKQGWFYRLFFTNQEDEARYFISHPENSKL